MTDRLQKTVKISKNIDIAVGYFFVSGFAEIADFVEKQDGTSPKIRILTSSITNKPTRDALLAAHESELDIERIAMKKESSSDQATKATEFIKSELEYMPQSTKQAEAISKMKRLIKDGSLEIRIYTREQLHAKLYLFDTDDDRYQYESIIGSSNFSVSGLRTHVELNFLTSDNSHYSDFKDWFESHWNDSTTKEISKDTLDVLENSWAGRKFTPKEVSGKAALLENIEPEEIEPGSIELYNFQKDAVVKAVKKIEDYGGVILSDVVGTGKTYMGAAILIDLLNRDVQHPLIICPARLKEMWEWVKKEFGIPGSVLSNADLGRLDEFGYCDAILIDESHAFKDEKRMRHKKMSEYMETLSTDVKMIMLTATPISNTVFDLKSQLKLFHQDMLEQLPVLIDIIPRSNKTKLDEYFANVEDERELTDEGREKIREILRYVLIRRTRKMILDTCKSDNGRPYIIKNGKKEYFPTPKLFNLEYDANKTYEGKFGQIEGLIDGLELARYTPGSYLKGDLKEDPKYADIRRTLSLRGIVKKSLLKRLESSIMAFDSSVKRYVEGHKWFLEQLKDDKVPVGKEFQEIIRKLIDNDSEDPDVEAELQKEITGTESKYDISAFRKKDWIETISDDIEKFTNIMKLLRGQEFEIRDDKLHKLKKLVNNNTEKLLIFSESSITAKYLSNYLKRVISGRRIEQLDSSMKRDKIDDVVGRFAPEFNGKEYPLSEQVNILVATDILSEGLNLQSCRILINYDFHWNPVRLIQRNGRIDRLGSKHKIIEIHNFLTTPDIDSSLELRDRVSKRIVNIRSILGTGSQVLENDEPPDKKGVCDLYDGKDVLRDPKIGNNIFELSDSGTDLQAMRIRENPEELKHYEKLPIGIRSASGNSKLLVACSADDEISDGTKNPVKSGKFNKYYEITDDGVKSVRQSTFLSQISKAGKEPVISMPKDFDSKLNKVWEKFDQDRVEQMQYIPKYKFQKHFVARLEKMTNVELKERIGEMKKFLLSYMVQQRHPYRDLKTLYQQPDLTDGQLLTKLEKINAKYGHIKLEKLVRRPKILYSLMVNE